MKTPDYLKNDYNHFSQNDKWLPDIIVLSPGGRKSYLELGALLKLESAGYLTNVNHYIGCSSGAIICLLLVAGYTVSEIIENILKENILQDITDLDTIQDIMDNGLVCDNNIEKKLKNKIIEKFSFELTLQQLYMATGLSLTIVTYNMDKDRPEYLSKDTEPNLSCISAVMMSINIPIIMKQRIYKGCSYVDGAMGNPYPIDIHDNHSYQILGLYVTDNKNHGMNPNWIFNVSFSSINQLRSRIIKYASNNCKNIELKYIPQSKRSAMLKQGYKETNTFLSQIEHPENFNLLLNDDDEIPFIKNDENTSTEVAINDKITIPITNKIFPIIQKLSNNNSS